jgi:hypothetical protein
MAEIYNLITSTFDVPGWSNSSNSHPGYIQDGWNELPDKLYACASLINALHQAAFQRLGITSIYLQAPMFSTDECCGDQWLENMDLIQYQSLV